jgi:hypothetical protein
MVEHHQPTMVVVHSGISKIPTVAPNHQAIPELEVILGGLKKAIHPKPSCALCPLSKFAKMICVRTRFAIFHVWGGCTNLISAATRTKIAEHLILLRQSKSRVALEV